MKNGPSKPIRDPREVGTYTLSEAAHYLRIPQATLRSWFFGAHYATRAGKRFFRPPLAPSRSGDNLLSFMNLVEAHVLDAIRREHDLPLQKVRRALTYIKSELPSEHPLADHRFMTDGVDLFVDRIGMLVSVSEHGQQAIREALEGYLKRIDRDRNGLAVRLFPYTRKRDLNEPKAIVIDPTVSFGRPVIAGTGIATAVIADRYKAGESIEQLADDYGRKPLEIQEAIRCELQRDAA